MTKTARRQAALSQIQPQEIKYNQTMAGESKSLPFFFEYHLEEARQNQLHQLLISMRLHPSRRSFLIFLTDAGRNLEDKLVPIASEALDEALQGLSEEEIKQLKVLLNKIFINVDE